MHKHRNENIYYNVDCIERAITEKKKILFKYFDIGVHGEKIYRRDGHHYVTEPITLIFNEDNYYLLCYSSRHDSTGIYRIDRMDSVTALEEPCTEKAVEMRKNTEQYTEQTFKMFHGPLENITLQFSEDLIGPVYDKFGEDTKIVSLGDNQYTAQVQIQKSPVFWGWLFQFDGEMTIREPRALAQEFNAKAQKVIDAQNKEIPVGKH